eukprot:PITA_06591
MQLTAQIGDYEMDQIILDLGSNANVLPKQTWERMGKPTLHWYPIQLWMLVRNASTNDQLCDFAKKFLNKCYGSQKSKFLEPKEIVQPYWSRQLSQALECYNVQVEDDDDDPRNINIPEKEGSHEVRGPTIKDPDITAPLKTKQVNIGTEEQPKYATLADYWDNATLEKVIELLREYQDLFPTKFTKLKGILGDLGMMKITLKPDAKPFKKRPYRLNPKYKAKVRKELDKMLVARIIKLVEESDWVSPMAVQEKKQKGEICICMDLRNLNDACVNDSFPTPFTDEVLENVGGQEAYSFTDGFLGYHQIKIAPKDRSKTTFTTEWGCF